MTVLPSSLVSKLSAAAPTGFEILVELDERIHDVEQDVGGGDVGRQTRVERRGLGTPVHRDHLLGGLGAARRRAGAGSLVVVAAAAGRDQSETRDEQRRATARGSSSSLGRSFLRLHECSGAEVRRLGPCHVYRSQTCETAVFTHCDTSSATLAALAWHCCRRNRRSPIWSSNRPSSSRVWSPTCASNCRSCGPGPAPDRLEVEGDGIDVISSDLQGTSGIGHGLERPPPGDRGSRCGADRAQGGVRRREVGGGRPAAHGRARAGASSFPWVGVVAGALLAVAVAVFSLRLARRKA